MSIRDKEAGVQSMGSCEKERNSMLAGCESQLIAYAIGNMNLGNDKAFLLKVVSRCLPYIGYPRSLNAITCINKAAE